MINICQVKFIHTKNTLVSTLCKSFRRNKRPQDTNIDSKKMKQLPEPTQTHAHRPHQRTHLQYTHIQGMLLLCCCLRDRSSCQCVSV